MTLRDNFLPRDRADGGEGNSTSPPVPPSPFTERGPEGEGVHHAAAPSGGRGPRPGHEAQPSFEAKLVSYLGAKMPGAKDITVSGLAKATEGLSYETYIFDASWNDGGQSQSKGLVVRLQPLHGPVPPYDVGPQFSILKALHGTEVPVPQPYWLERDASILGAPFFVMEKVGGEIPLPWKSAGTSYNDPAQRDMMGREMVRVLAALHTVDWKARGVDFLPAPTSSTEYALRELGRWDRVQKENEYLAEPIIAEACGWLKAHLPRAPRTTIVHGDYRIGNFIWSGGRIAAFLDWEMVALGDPMSDLGWMCMKCFQGHTGKVNGLLDRDEFLRSYEEASGIPVNQDAVLWWEVFGYVKLVAILTAGVRAYIDGRRDDVRLAIFEFDTLSHLDILAKSLGF